MKREFRGGFGREGRRGWRRIVGTLLLAVFVLTAPAARAQETTQIEIFVAGGALEQETALRLAALAREAYPQADWRVTFEEDVGLSLRELVLADRAPTIALCSPQEAMLWAREGLLAPLDGRVPGLSRMAEAVVDACVDNETLYMAPLLARHRRVAVNADMLIARGLGYLLDSRAHPAWVASELYQAMEEATLSGALAMELWEPRPENSAAIEAFVQALYGGMLLAPDSGNMIQAMTWLRDMVKNGWIAQVQGRETALSHFLAGETLLFLDWTDEEERRFADRLREGGVDVETVPYPSAQGLTVRSFDLTGAAVFAGRDAQAVSLARQVISIWTEDERSGGALGERGVWDDGAVWLPCLGALGGGGTLRGLFCEAVAAMLSGEQSPQGALRQVREVMQAVSGG